ncbi:calcium-translocating P-type ATPase, SERCA-type [Candidatus Pacearchaeota archaeon]|nr:calcium-translocating P-type ATPase, SERCA-type [Candidatus Pacearchaeota archaeon]
MLKELNVDAENGLSNEEVEKRKSQYGLNELKAKKKINLIVLFFSQFRSFIIYILLFAVLISLISGEYIDSVVILVILLFNAFFGFVQEYKAEKAIEALKKLTELKSKVIRNSQIILIDTKEIVPGDIMLLEEGNKISADARIIEAISFESSEASLTGESMPVSKHSDAIDKEVTIADQRNMLFSGTTITRGKARAVVVATGMNSEIGKIAGLVSEFKEEPTPLQRKLEHFGKYIGVAIIFICFIVFILGVVKEGLIKLLFQGQFLDFVFASKTWFLIAVSLAVAAVPEGLPAIVTIVLALGVIKMVKRNALIRRLPSVETLGETTIIATDKTGTLTKNEMTVKVAYANLKDIQVGGEGYDIKGRVLCNGSPLHRASQFGKNELLLFNVGVLCNNASLNIDKNKAEIIGDPTEAALLISAEKAGIKHAEFRKAWKRISEEPFDSIRKMMSTINVSPDTKRAYVFTKGAPEKVLERCSRILINGKIIRLRNKLRQELLEKNDEFTKGALRVLGFAYKEHKKNEKIEDNLIFVGLQGMIDPPHPEVKESIRRCKEAGIRVIMVTGDNKNTAEAIGREIGISGEGMNGLDFAKLGREEQFKAIENVSIFSRVEPKHKVIIIELLQSKGEIVAMTGDGVNDAPAIKKADLGIAMGISGTDVAKEASDMVLQDDNFTSIVNAVEEGRGIYENIKKFVNYLLSCNLGEVLVILLAIILGWPLPMTAVMILWLNLVTDGLPALALGVDPYPKDVMKRPPKKTSDGILNKSTGFNIIYVSIFITLGVLILFKWAMIKYSGTEFYLGKIQTIAFTSIIVMELSRLQAIRSEYKIGIFSNKYLILAVASSLILQLIVIYTPLRGFFDIVPLSLVDWGMIIVITTGVFIISMFGVIARDKIFERKASNLPATKF